MTDSTFSNPEVPGFYPDPSICRVGADYYLACCTGGVVAPTTGATTTPSTSSPTTQPAGEVLSEVHTAGQVKASGNAVQYSRPGVYFEGRVRGTGVGVVLNDAAADYDIQVDGKTVATLVTPGQTTYWVNGLSNAEHTVRVVKRNENPWSTSEFGGFVAATGGAVLVKPAARSLCPGGGSGRGHVPRHLVAGLVTAVMKKKLTHPGQDRRARRRHRGDRPADRPFVVVNLK
jgi:carbohydrate esterase-like protein